MLVYNMHINENCHKEQYDCIVESTQNLVVDDTEVVIKIYYLRVIHRQSYKHILLHYNITMLVER